MLNQFHPLDSAVRDAIRAQLTDLLGVRANGADVVALMAEDALVGISAVCALTDLSRPQVWRGVAAETFPKPLAPSEGRRAWLLSEIKVWIADRKAERDTGKIGRRSPQLRAVVTSAAT